MGKWLEHISGKELKFFSIFSMVLLVMAAIAAGTPARLAEGIWLIVVSRDALITDYFELAGYGAAFLNAALVMGISIFYCSGENSFHRADGGGFVYECRIWALGKEPGQYSARDPGYGFVCKNTQDEIKPLYLYGAVRHMPCASDYRAGFSVSIWPDS